MASSDEEVSVTLLINGGHAQTIFLARSDPLLAQLVASINEKNYGGSRPARPFNIHVDQGRRSLLFSSSDLVALITDPPMIHSPNLKAAPVTAVPIEKSRYILLENFIDETAHRELLNFVIRREKDFVPSTVSTKDAEYRHSLVLYDFPQFASMFRDRVRSLLPRLKIALGTGDFQVGDIECQLTAHNDGDYFRLHNDGGSPDTLDRRLTFVYYFNHEPKAFSGGQFRLYDSRIAEGRYECGEPSADIEPKNNSVLFFPSHCHHEVLPVRCPSTRFIDSRFTINGWVRRAGAT